MILFPDKALPIIYIDIGLKFGSIYDPIGKEGLASLTASLLLRGTRQKSAIEFYQKLDDLGAEIFIAKYMESLRVQGIVLAQKLEPFLMLIQEMLDEPAFSEEELQKVKEQQLSMLQDELSDDADIASRRFQEYFLCGHPYGRMTSGTVESIKNISITDVKQFYAQYYCASSILCAASGDFQKEQIQQKIKKFLKSSPQKSFVPLQINEPKMVNKKKLLMLDKPERTQSQIYIGQSGISYHHKHYHALMIANHAFGGGSFSARLMKEVREKRGWSYGAYSSFVSAKKPLYFVMQAAPAIKDTVPAIELMLKLLKEFSQKGMTKEEFHFTKTSLLNQAVFMQDTVRKRLQAKMTEELLELPKNFYSNYIKKLKSTSYAEVQKAIKSNMQQDDVFVCVLSTAALLQDQIKKIKEIENITIRGYQELPQVS